MPSGKIVALHLKPGKGQLTPVNELHAVAGKGFEGDRCFGQRSRQTLLVGTETLSEFGYAPGALREQITVDLPDLQSIAPGTRLAAGTCVLQIEMDCAPCAGMAKQLGEDPDEFRAKTAGKRGMLAVVSETGTIKVGDEVRVLDA